MNIYMITEYINKLKKEDINNYAQKQGIKLDKEELDIVYNYIKTNYKNIIYYPIEKTLSEIKYKVKPLTYTKIEELITKYKNIIDNFTNKRRLTFSYLIYHFIIKFLISYHFNFIFIRRIYLLFRIIVLSNIRSF